jgi:hypothetical protein
MVIRVAISQTGTHKRKNVIVEQNGNIVNQTIFEI